MVVIRMQRAGGKNKPTYRVVVADQRFQRDGRFLEKLGYYDPKPSTPLLSIDVARADEWIAKGAQPSPAVAVLLKKAKAAQVTA
ncbi:MAG: 30S ribosomal protein S16 [Candidatus Eisenbacteria bacterium]|nr:30S ribosomal protein S16 [Candidatus Eisenbacteria bacterium]MCC7142404.1 30S ribosomal protein S16 [Candidatus Eisenbacteria bacterium]